MQLDRLRKVDMSVFNGKKLNTEKMKLYFHRNFAINPPMEHIKQFKKKNYDNTNISGFSGTTIIKK